MKIIKALFASILILQVHTSFGVEISGYVKRNTSDPSPASVYVNGAKIATASASGYFEGEVPEGELTIFAEINLPNATERSLPRTINVSEDTTVQLTVAPLRTVTINVSASVNEYGDSPLRETLLVRSCNTIA